MLLGGLRLPFLLKKGGIKMWENTIKLLVQKFPCIGLLEDHIYFNSSLARPSGPMFCRVEECNLEIMMTFRINGFDTSDFPLGSTVFGIHFPDVDLLESIGEMQYEILRKMVESRLGIEATEEIMRAFTVLHEIGHYLDHFNGFGMEEAIAEMSIREEVAATALEEGEDKANIMYREIPSERRADEFALSILESVIR